MEENSNKSPRAKREEEILAFWKEKEVFKKTLEKKASKGDFIFYEGPPTANGRPGIHHLEARAFKDAIPRYKTMQGFHVRRKAGWDTHGLPVELEVEKALGLKSKKEIEEYGIDKFNEECRKSVWKYVDEWKSFTDRIGYWVDLDDPYITYENSYIESIWKILSHIDKRKLLYKDYKVVPWCPRCGTALSSHELAQGYKDVKDLSIYAKFRVLREQENGKSSGRFAQPDVSVFLLAWTTTPWTLPGNVALAVGEDVHYAEVRIKNQESSEHLILAKERLGVLNSEYEVVSEMKGSDLVGLEYEPLYPFLKEGYKGENLEKAYKVYAADFVTTEDGTGIVHTAVMYGIDDFVLGTEIGLPKHHLVDETGHFLATAGFLAHKFVKDEETDVLIIKDLASRGLLFHKEKHEHSYPFCWRCKTPLIYYARDSWYIRMSELRDKLVKENDKINWEPNYIKEGRFGEWLKEVKDWALSRERYWGTPLPVWISQPGNDKLVISNIEDLKKYTKRSGNKYLLMRHGGTNSNKLDIVSYKNEANDHLTPEGENQTKESAEKLKKEKVDLIIASPFVRTRETAEIVRTVLGLPEEAVVLDDRLKEVNAGEFDGRSWSEYHEYVEKLGDKWFNESIPGGESLREVVKRVGESLYELEATYRNKNILIVTHGGPTWIAHVVAGLYQPESNKSYHKPHTHAYVEEFKKFENAEVRELPFIPLPHNANFELDLHRPYIDEVILEKDGRDYYRTKEVIDVWFDSGAMPFAQDADLETKNFPADFISEAIDQTRGWFYTLHAIGVLMERGHAYKNVICLGHILDKEGKKMSKSVGNVVNPWEMADKYGVDALRLWMYSVNQPGESKNFDERTVDELNKRVFNILDNVYTFYDLYRDKSLEIGSDAVGENVLDQWIFHRSNELINLVTDSLDNYKLLEPVRAIREFVNDLSTWYLRRSRERIKDGDHDAKKTLYFMLKRVSKLLAPFAPFYTEDLYQKLRGEGEVESAHLTDWPHFTKVSSDGEKIISNMSDVRKLVSLALEQRSRANIKVRQPLGSLKIKNTKLSEEYLDLIKDEVNVKRVIQDENIIEEVELDTALTSELEEEGRVREIVRTIQDTRKEKGLKPGEKMSYEVPEAEKELFAKYAEEIKKATDIEF